MNTASYLIDTIITSTDWNSIRLIYTTFIISQCKMKKKKTTLRWDICGIIFLLLYACVNDDWLPDNKTQELPAKLTFGKNRELTIEIAKNWYTMNEMPVTRMATTHDNKLGFLVTPSWNHAKEWKKGQYEVVEASLRSNVNVLFYDQEIKSRSISMNKEDKKKVMNVGRTVILKNLLTKEVISFNMVIIGSYNYLMQKENHLSDNNYLHRESNFDGTILFFQPNGEFVNGWKYENGKIMKQLSPANDIEHSLSNDVAITKTRGVDCLTKYDYYSYYNCPENTRSYNEGWMNFYNDDEFGNNSENEGWWGKDPDKVFPLDEVEVPGSPCSIVTVAIPYLECTYVEDSSSGGGSGGGEYNPISHPLTKQIIKNTDGLEKEQLDKLERVIQEMKEKMCYAEAIQNHLMLNEFKYNSVTIDPALGGEAGTSYLSDGRINLKFRNEDCIDYNSFSHELVHLFQSYLGQYTGLESRGMMEYERNLIDDIMFYAQYKGKENKIPDEYWRHKGPLVYGDTPSANNKEKYIQWRTQSKEYQKWLTSITNKGIPSAISTEEFNKWKSLFYENSRPYSPDRGYNYDINYMPKALLKALELAKVNCQQ